MKKTPLSQTRKEGVHILYDAAILDQPKAETFDPAWWRDQSRLSGEAQGRGSAYFLQAGEAGWVLRHYRRGGMVSRFNRDRYLFTGLERTRPFREARLLARMIDMGLPVPRPVAGGVAISGLSYRGDLIIERVPGRPLSGRLEDDSADVAVFERVGQTIRRFHDQGVYHADLNAHNILVDDEGRVFLIDFDRGAIRPPGRWRRGNLERLQRSMKKVLDQRWANEPRWSQAWLALEQGYSRPV